MKVEDKEQNREEYLKDVDIFVTNRCNSNCIMCPLSETVRRKSDNGRIEEIFQQIKELPENVEYVNVTGGEPTLVGQAFFEIMDKLKMKFQNSGFQLLTNSLNNNKMQFSPQAMAGVEGLKKLRYLPNGRIDFLSVNESARLQANMHATMLNNIDFPTFNRDTDN